jgi:hypothetical protein
MKKDTTPLFKIDWSKPHQAIIKITPEDALRVLENHNNGNRFLRQGGAKYIAAQIIGGEWIENHPQPICFSSGRLLIDGQHRMNGILLSNKTVWASCHFGVDPEYIKYMDTGISRALYDRVTFVENKIQNQFISGVISLRYNCKNKGKVTPEKAMEEFLSLEDSYRTIAEIRQKRIAIGQVMVGSAFVDYHAKYGQEAADMYSELFKMTTDCQPAQALKNFLLTRTINEKLLYPYIVSACMANHEGRQVKQIKAATWR